MNSDPIVLNYGDCLLRKSDVKLLTGPYWLNDNIISFYFEYLTNNFNDSSPDLIFISPEVTQCIKISPIEQINLFLDPLEANYKKYLFFALNNNNRPQTAGGSHWSLLVISIPDRSAYHFDSAHSTNSNTAELFAKKIFHFRDINGSFIDGICLQQTNSYDCGIHLLGNCEYLANKLIESDREAASNKVFNLKSDELDDIIKNMRKKLLSLIAELQRNY